MKLIENNYELKLANIKSITLTEDVNNFIKIVVWYEKNNGIQSYALINLNTIELKEAIVNLKNFLGINDLTNAKGKKIVCVCNSSNIFAFMNTELNQFFSLKAKYQAEEYKQSLEKIIKMEENQYLNFCSKEEAIMMATLKNCPEIYKNEDIKKLINTHKLNIILEKELNIKEYKSRSKI